MLLNEISTRWRKKFKVKFSFIIPVYNRPTETRELLESLTHQTDRDFSVIVVEDGSNLSSEQVAGAFRDQLDISYFFKQNSGPGPSRNFGCEKAGGDYFIFLDSDCLVPGDYMKIVRDTLKKKYTDAFGGPDRAHPHFTNFQKAINFSMTSFLTTGGIRGAQKSMEKFHPRSFNMGFSKEVFSTCGGFARMRFGEDVDLSIRIMENGFTTQLITGAFVYHKRRTSLKQFFMQVYNSGIARINLYKRHPGSLKYVHAAPALFTLGVPVMLLLSVLVSWYFTIPLLFHMILLFLFASFKNRSPVVGILAVATSYTQLLGYGAGFLNAFWRRIILRKDEYAAFSNKFYS